MRFAFGNLIHWTRHSGWKAKLWQQRSLPLTTINMEVLLLLEFHNLQGLHHNNWKKKIEKGFCYSCDNKHTKSHKCAENKLFYIDYEEDKEKERET